LESGFYQILCSIDYDVIDWLNSGTQFAHGCVGKNNVESLMNSLVGRSMPSLLRYCSLFVGTLFALWILIDCFYRVCRRRLGTRFFALEQYICGHAIKVYSCKAYNA
jgi:hypothetical protein